ncbi:MAG: hypothetical protein IJP88_04430 [Synergistaceae bacterium]|nr:hypothetical protein [Synergistaceae bacterium]MBR0096402.1 hypothetical protein [Synergistaceae bacterium]
MAIDKEAEAIISRLDKLIEQQQLTNSLIAIRDLDYKLQIIRDVYRIIDS